MTERDAGVRQGIFCLNNWQIVADDQAGYKSNRYISPENPPDPGYIPSESPDDSLRSVPPENAAPLSSASARAWSPTAVVKWASLFMITGT